MEEGTVVNSPGLPAGRAVTWWQKWIPFPEDEGLLAGPVFRAAEHLIRAFQKTANTPILGVVDEFNVVNVRGWRAEAADRGVQIWGNGSLRLQMLDGLAILFGQLPHDFRLRSAP